MHPVVAVASTGRLLVRPWAAAISKASNREEEGAKGREGVKAVSTKQGEEDLDQTLLTNMKRRGKT